MSSLLLATATFVFLGLFSGAAYSQADSKITTESKAYGDWTLQCATKVGVGKRCAIQQQVGIVNDEGKAQVVMAVNIKKGSGTNKSNKMTFVLPLATYLPTGMQLYFDGAMDQNIPIMYCNQGGCYVNIFLEQPLIDKITKAKTIDVAIFSIADNSKPIQNRVSNKGFTAALAALK